MLLAEEKTKKNLVWVKLYIRRFRTQEIRRKIKTFYFLLKISLSMPKIRPKPQNVSQKFAK